MRDPLSSERKSEPFLPGFRREKFDPVLEFGAGVETPSAVDNRRRAKPPSHLLELDGRRRE